MKAFIAYRFSGEDPKLLEPLLSAVVSVLKEKGVESYCSFFDEASFQDKSMSAREIMDHAFKIIDESDFLFVLQTSDDKSEGMLMEIGYCIAKGIPIVVATKDVVTFTYVPEMSGSALRWKDQNDLTNQIKSLDVTRV